MPGAAMELVIFEIENVRYALRSADVSEVLRAVAVVPLPKAPPVVEGIINVRGRVVPVLDLRARFGLPPRSLRHTDHLVLAQARDRLVGIRADRAIEVARVEPGDVELPDAASRGTAYLAGVAKLPDGLVLVHDLGTFLDAAEQAALDEATEAAHVGVG